MVGPFQYLVNGASIAQVPVAEITYWHVELPAHDVILAEGQAAETYLDIGNRGAFENGGAAPLHLHPDFALRTWEAEACARLIVSGAALTEIRRRLLARTGIVCSCRRACAACGSFRAPGFPPMCSPRAATIAGLAWRLEASGWTGR
jgi:hypothetical protein